MFLPVRMWCLEKMTVVVHALVVVLNLMVVCHVKGLFRHVLLYVQMWKMAM